MIAYYLALDVPLEATDQEIRDKYLALIKKHPPEKDPERFQQVSTAYEKIKSPRARVRTVLFDVNDTPNTEAALQALGEAARPHRVRIGLKTLMQGLSSEDGKIEH